MCPGRWRSPLAGQALIPGTVGLIVAALAVAAGVLVVLLFIAGT
jgi:hypothetical protein